MSAAGQCEAMTCAAGKTYNLQRWTRAYDSKPCRNKARYVLGHLRLCSVHLRMAEDGVLPRDGVVPHPMDRRNIRDNPRLSHTWAQGLVWDEIKTE